MEATAVVLLREHMQGVLASMIGLDYSYNWGYRCCHTEHLSMAYFDLRHGHALASNTSLKEPLDSALQDGYLTEN